MRYLMGLVLAGGILVGTAARSEAQFSMTIGNPYGGQGIAIGNPGYGYGGYGYGMGSGYSSVYNSYSSAGYVAGPGSFNYSSGYAGAPIGGYGPVAAYGYAPRPYGYGGNPYGYGNRPYYGGYGYGNNGYGSNNGFRPFRGMGGFRR